MSELPFSIKAPPLETGGCGHTSTDTEAELDENTDLMEEGEESRLPGRNAKITPPSILRPTPNPVTFTELFKGSRSVS